MWLYWKPVFCCLMACLMLVEAVKTSPKKQKQRPKLKKKPTKKLHSRKARIGGATTGDTKTVDPDKFLEQFGYLQKLPSDVQHSNRARKEGVKHFQRMYSLPVTGKLDRLTLKYMAKPRCGMKDMIPGGELPSDVMFDLGLMKANNFYAPGYKWPKQDLTWRALDYSYDMDSGQQRRAFHEAFKYWSKVAALNFHEIGGGKADIEIKFGYGLHGDNPGNEFDGRGGVLAHAYFPEDGRAHFDEAEMWTEGTEEGTNLRIVAAHEFGHALGLGHSNIRGALMAPYYQGYKKDFHLHPDDIQAIQSLYGGQETGRRIPRPRPRPTQRPRPRPRPTQRPRPRPRPTQRPRPRPRPTQRPRPRPRPTQRPRPRARPTQRPSAGHPRKPNHPGKPNPCTVKFNAIYTAHDTRTYVFNGKWVWRLDDWQVEEGFPVSIASVYQKPPYNIEAAVYSWRTRYTYFFKGANVFKYYGFHQVERKIIRERGYPKSPSAAVMGRDGIIYLLKGSYFYVFDEYKMGVTDKRHRRISTRWYGVPNDVEGAVTLRDGATYFFKGSKYWKYDEYYRRVHQGYPKEKSGPWMGPTCGGKYVPK